MGVCGFYVCIYSVCVCGFQVCAWTVCEVGGRSTNGTLTRPPSSPLSPSPRSPASTVSIPPSLDYMYTHTPLNKTLRVVLVPPQKLVTNMTEAVQCCQLLSADIVLTVHTRDTCCMQTSQPLVISSFT